MTARQVKNKMIERQGDEGWWRQCNESSLCAYVQTDHLMPPTWRTSLARQLDSPGVFASILVHSQHESDDGKVAQSKATL